MKRYIRVYLLVIVTLLASSGYAANYEDGQAAYDAKNFKKAIEIWETLAEQGDVASQLNLAKLYSTGFQAKEDITKKDKTVAFKLEKDKTAAFELYKQASEQGSQEAQLQLGLIYLSGQGDVKSNPEKARELFLKSAKQGYANAQYYYGVTYFRGRGVLTDYVQAHAWMHVAFVNGYEPAKGYKESIAEVLSEEQLEESKSISDQLLAEIK